jgi:hypothetical protein
LALSLGELFGTIGLDTSEYKTKLKDAQKDLKDFGTAGVVAAGAAATAIGVALGKGIVDNLNIDAGNRKLKAQLNLTTEESAKAGKAAGSLFAKNYGESMEDVQSATGSVMSSIAGMRTASQADLEDITGKALNLASTFDVDVAEAAASAGLLMKNGLAKDATQAMDLITDAMQGVPESMRGEIFPIMDEYGQNFATLGIDGTTAMGIVKAASQDGAIGMDKMGDSLKEFTLLTLAGDKTQAAAFESMGLNTGKMATAMAKGGEEGQAAFAQVVAGLQEIEDPAKQAQTAIDLFGTPLEDLGTSNIPKFLGQIDPLGDAFGTVEGAADDMGKALSEGPSAGFDAFKRQAHAGLIDVVNFALMPAVTDFANHLNTTIGPAITDAANWIMNDMMPALQGFSDWFGENQGTISLWAGVVGAVLFPIFARILVELGIQVWAWTVAGAGAVKTAALYVVNSYKMVGAWIRMGAAAIVSGAQTAYVWLLYRVEAAKTAAAMVVNAAKIVAQWVVMATGATVNAVKMAAAWVAGVITGAARAVAAMIVTAAQYVAQWVIMAVQSGIQALRMAAAWVVGVGIPAVGAGIMMGIQAAIVVGAWILMATQATIQAARMAAAWFIALGPIGWITAAIIGLVALVILNWEKVSTFTSSVWAAIVGFISEAWANIVSGVSTGIDNVIGFFTGLPGRILGALGNLGNLLLDAGGQILGGFLKGLTQGFENVKNFVGGIGTWIADHKGPKRYDLGLLVPAGGWIMDGLGTGIENSMPALGSQLSDVSWMIQNGIDPELQGSGQYAFSSTAGSAGPPNGPSGSGTPLTLAPTISGANDPEETWRVFKSRANESLAAQGSDVRL